MAITTIPRTYWPLPAYADAGGLRFDNIVIDADGEGIGIIFRPFVAGTITHIGLNVETLTAAGNAVAMVQSVDATTGLPSGIFATGASRTQAISATGWQTFVIDTPPTVATTDYVACTVVRDASSSLNAVFNEHTRGGLAPRESGLPYTVKNTTGSFALGGKANVLNIAVAIDGVYQYLPAAMPLTGVIAETTFASGSTPDELGNRLYFPTGVRVCAVWALAYDNDFSLKLYGTSEVTLAHDKDQQNIDAFVTLPLATKQELLKETEYRVSILPGASNVATQEYTFASNALIKAFTDSLTTYKTSRTDAGSWTNNDAAMMPCGVVIDGIDIPAGGGGGNIWSLKP